MNRVLRSFSGDREALAVGVLRLDADVTKTLVERVRFLAEHVAADAHLTESATCRPVFRGGNQLSAGAEVAVRSVHHEPQNLAAGIDLEQRVLRGMNPPHDLTNARLGNEDLLVPLREQARESNSEDIDGRGISEHAGQLGEARGIGDTGWADLDRHVCSGLGVRGSVTSYSVAGRPLPALSARERAADSRTALYAEYKRCNWAKRMR